VILWKAPVVGSVVCVVAAVALPSLCAEAAEPDVPATTTGLDRAAADLAAGRLADARDGFRRLADDASQPAFVRSLGRFGLAEAALAAGDADAAEAAWRELADNASLPRAHREMARERIAAAGRIRQGKPGYDPAAHRAKLPAIPEPAVVFYVRPDGNDSGDGSKARPFRSLVAARDAVRAWQLRPDPPIGSVQILIGGGVYPVEQTLELAAEDSGKGGTSPVVYMAEPGRQPVFCGGVRIASWKPITDATARERLDSAVRERVLQADLKTLGVTDFGDATALRKCPELFCGGVPQTLARWPNEGFIKTGEPLGIDTFTVWGSIPGCRDGKFRFIEDRPVRWTDERDARLYGYWFWDWFEEYQTVDAIDAEARTFTLSKPYSRYGYRKDQRYFAANLFCELDRPGEWYLDRGRGVVYWLPPEDVDLAAAETALSLFDGPFARMENVHDVILLGLTFQEGRGDGIHVRGGSDDLIAGCTFRRLGGDAVVIDGGWRHGVFGCLAHTLGCGGMRITGGNRETLARGDHFVENCTVYDVGRLKRTYSPAVRLDGCSNRVAHNLFERMPSSAMRIEGNDQTIELNLVRHVVEESDDQGGIDMYGNPLYRGVVIRFNRFSHIGGGTHCGGAGVRLDDMISGVAVYGNLFERCGAVKFGGVQIHGGKENLIDGNVFLDCFAGVSFSRWSEQR